MNQKTLLHFFSKNGIQNSITPFKNYDENNDYNSQTEMFETMNDMFEDSKIEKAASMTLTNYKSPNLLDYFHTVYQSHSNSTPIKKPLYISETSTYNSTNSHPNQIEIETANPITSTIKKPDPRIFGTLDHWLFKCEKMLSNKWPYLPKDLMRSIMQFLPLEDNAKLSYVCKYWLKCYNSIWLSYDFFARVSFKNLTERQLKKIFEKSGRLPHIRKMKSIMNGKKVDAFFKRTKLSTKISKEVNKGKLFEIFSIKPKRPNLSLFITDKEVVDICESSLYSLQYINLTSCHLLTQHSFTAIANCKNIQHLSINNSSLLTDWDVFNILQNCKSITKLSFSGCSSLSDEILKIIPIYCKKLDKLELARNIKMEMNNISRLMELTSLIKLNINYSKVKVDHFIQFATFSQIKWLSIEGCLDLDDSFLNILSVSNLRNHLEYLNIKNNRKFSEEGIWNFVSSSQVIKQIDIPNDLYSQRILEKIEQNLLNTKLSTQMLSQ